MDATALLMAMYGLDGLPSSDKLSNHLAYGYVDKLRDILLERMFHKDTTYQNVFSGKSSSASTAASLNSISKLFYGRQLWEVFYLELTEECGIDAWNQYSGFTYDITDFFIICLVTTYSGVDIVSLSKDTFSDFLPELYEMYFPEENSDYDEQMQKEFFNEISIDCIELIQQMKLCSAVTDWETVQGTGLILLKNFSEYIFADALTPVDVFNNIQPIAEFCFVVFDGIYRVLYTFANQYLNLFLQHKEYFSNNTEFTELISLLELLEKPIYDDGYGFEPIVALNKEYYSITVIEADKSNIYNARPFLGQLLDRIDELTLVLISLLPENLLPAVAVETNLSN